MNRDGEKRMRIKSFTTAFLYSSLPFIFFCPDALHAQYDATPQQAKVIDEWIQQGKNKLPAWLKGVPDWRLVDKNPSFYLDWGKNLSSSMAKKMGIPEKSGKVKLTSLYQAKAEGFLLTYVEYRGNEMEGSEDLYIQLSSGKYQRLFSWGSCSDFSLIKLGPKAPVWIVAHDSACGSGFTDHIYEINPDRTLKKIVDLQCWQAGWKAIDLDKDGWREIIHSTDINYFPPDIKAKLVKMKIYKEPTGPILQVVEILKWKRGKYIRVGRYYEHGDAW